MKTTSLLVVAGILTLMGASHAEEGEKTKKAKGPNPEILAKYDKNQDGKLCKEEKAEMKKDKQKEKADKPKAEKKPKTIDPAILEKYDTNKDGKLCKEEKAEMKKDKQKEKADKPKPEKKQKKAKKEDDSLPEN